MFPAVASANRRSWRHVAVTALALAIALLGAELTTRWLDGYAPKARLVVLRTDARTRATVSQKWLEPAAAAYYVDRLPVAPGVDRGWFALDPAPRRETPIDSALDRRYWSHKGYELSSEYEWNRDYVRRAVCGEAAFNMAVFSHTEDLFLFPPVDGKPYPAFRFRRHTHYPSGLTTNNFGWRGADVALNKPPATVRIAFVGASTTIDPHGDPFSYPEYVGRWLNEWSRSHRLGIGFDAINAGREGVSSESIAAVVATELVPVRPDLVVYYEGSNQFWPADFISEPLPPRPAQVARNPPLIEQYSALAVRLRNLWNASREGREPPKPPLRVDWPAALNEQNPALDDPRLPVQLPAILIDLDRMRAALTNYGGTLMPSSFVWLVQDGLVLDRQRDAGLYSYLNESYWPFSYPHMRRMVDFENRVFRKYAAAYGLPFNDLAAVYPADPRLFLDAIHMTPAGIKLKAWLVFQQLVPEVEARIADGRLPVLDRGGRTLHPAFARGTAPLVRLADVRQNCS
jgi:hypothetical protein